LVPWIAFVPLNIYDVGGWEHGKRLNRVGVTYIENATKIAAEILVGIPGRRQRHARCEVQGDRSLQQTPTRGLPGSL